MPWINLPYGGPESGFDAQELVNQIVLSGRQYIIQGQTNCGLADHPKRHSLDVWLRKNWTSRRDTKQAVNDVVEQLVSTGLFEVGKFNCPDGSTFCKGLKLKALAQG